MCERVYVSVCVRVCVCVCAFDIVYMCLLAVVADCTGTREGVPKSKIYFTQTYTYIYTHTRTHTHTHAHIHTRTHTHARTRTHISNTWTWNGDPESRIYFTRYKHTYTHIKYLDASGGTRIQDILGIIELLVRDSTSNGANLFIQTNTSVCMYKYIHVCVYRYTWRLRAARS